MRLRVDSDDVDTLEPLTPGSDEPLPGFPRAWYEGGDLDDEPRRRVVAPPRDPRARRLWFVALGLAAMSLLQFAGAAYLRAVESDLRALENQWRAAVAVDADRRTAERALSETAMQYGRSPSLQRQRDRLFEAAAARLGKIGDEIATVSPQSSSLEDLRRDMSLAIDERRRDLDAGSVLLGDENDLAVVTERLDRALRRWRLAPRSNDDARLTTARELVERLGRMADERTGLSIAAVSTDGLYTIYPDANLLAHRPIALSREATVHVLGDALVVVDSGTATAYPTSTSAAALWQTPADTGVSAGDDETMWIQAGSMLRRIDATNAVVSEMTLPDGSQLFTITDGGRAIVRVPGRPLQVTTDAGDLADAATYRRGRGDGSFGMNGLYVAGLDNDGRVLIAPQADREGSRFSVLRADVPRFFDMAVIP